MAALLHTMRKHAAVQPRNDDFQCSRAKHATAMSASIKLGICGNIVFSTTFAFHIASMDVPYQAIIIKKKLKARLALSETCIARH